MRALPNTFATADAGVAPSHTQGSSMPTLPPQTQRWPADRALLLVHGIGNAQPGDYDALVALLLQVLGPGASKIAMYFLYYDQVNDWFAAKTQLALQVASL